MSLDSTEKALSVDSALQSEIKIWRDEKSKLFGNSLFNLIDETGTLLIETGIMQKNYPLVYEDFTNATKDPQEIMESLVDTLDTDPEGLHFRKSILQFLLLAPKLANFMELDPDDKIETGEKIKSIMIQLREIFRRFLDDE